MAIARPAKKNGIIIIRNANTSSNVRSGQVVRAETRTWNASSATTVETANATEAFAALLGALLREKRLG